jgi:hypothetical protein
MSQKVEKKKESFGDMIKRKLGIGQKLVSPVPPGGLGPMTPPKKEFIFKDGKKIDPRTGAWMWIDEPPAATPTPTRKPASVVTANMPPDEYYQPGESRYIDVSRNQGTSTVPVLPPPKWAADAFWSGFPQDATAAATVAFAENMGYKPNAINPHNANGSIDYGLFQNNSYTFNEMLSKKPFRERLNAVGIYSTDDLLGDATKSAHGAKIRHSYGPAPQGNPWNWWYGWKDRGFDPYGYTK